MFPKKFKESMDKLKKELEEGEQPEIYWDYRDELSEDQIIKIMENRNCDDLYESIWENSSDHIYDIEMEYIKDKMSWYDDEIEEEFDTEDPGDYYEEIIEEFDLRSCVGVDYNIKSLFGNIPVRIPVYSNYDCMNSHWLTSQEGYGYEDHYFGAFVDALNLNPTKVEKVLIEAEVNVCGEWPNLKDRNGKEYVSYEGLMQELENSCGGANLLVFLGMLDLYKWITTETTEITIPKGNNCGLFDNFSGSGSVLEMKLIRDMTIDLNKHGETEYDHFGMRFDKAGAGYGVLQVYSAYESIFGDTIQINEEAIVCQD